MVNLEYHKGEICRFTSILCQEGYCQDCMIHLQNDQDSRPIAKALLLISRDGHPTRRKKTSIC